ncbi:MAG: DNA polymerase I [Chloroflexota bacterium]
MGETLVLFDGNALVHRAFHALPPLTTTQGELVNAVYGFAQMLFKAVSEIKPQCWAIAFDKAAPTFRHQQYEAYKAQRAKPPEGLYEQFGRVRQLVQSLNIPVYEMEGYEADDLLGTLARQAVEKGLEVVIVSGDADTLQLVGPSVRVLTPGRVFTQTTIYDEAAVREKYGLSPEQLPDFKGLRGDPSDNIPGVRGIGEKTAAKLLAQFGTIEELYRHLDEVNLKTKEALEQHEADARLGKRLATIVRDVPIELDLERCRAGDYDRRVVNDLLRELEFKSLLNRLPAGGGRSNTSSGLTTPVASGPVEAQCPVVPVQMSMFAGPDEQGAASAAEQPVGAVALTSAGDLEIKPVGSYWVVDSPEALDRLCASLANAFGFAIDLETDSVDAMNAKLVGIALAYQPGQAHYIPVGHVTTGSDRAKAPGQLPVEQVVARLKPLLENPDLPKYAHNGKYEMIVLSHYGVELRGLAFDTMVAAWLLDPSQRTYSLTDLTWHRLGIELTPIASLIGKGKNATTMATVPIPAAALYAGAHADVTYRLMRLLGPELSKEGLWGLFADVEMQLVPVLANMERNGVALDVEYLGALSRQLAERIGSIEMEVYRAVGHRFNVNSTQQLGSVLFDELRLPPVRKTKTGYSTDAEVLDELRGQHPVVDLVLEYRQLQKLKSTYADSLPTMINPKTGRLHTSFNQTGTVTGRLSSSDPNLQNIPIRTELGRQVRRAFIAGRKGTKLLAADYSQIELRILAHVCQDERLLAAFAAGADIHAATAAEVFGVPMEQVTPDMRRFAKVVNFGVLYGMSDYGLATRSGLSRQDAAQFINKYFSTYSSIERYLENTKRQAMETGFVTTLLGRRRYIPEINVAHRAARMAAERTAVNMPIQGTAADIIKLAMIAMQRALVERGMKSQMLLQVHDELVFEVPIDELDEMKGLVRNVMQSAMPLTVELKVDLKVGDNWRDIESQPEIELMAAGRASGVEGEAIDGDMLPSPPVIAGDSPATGGDGSA